MGKSVANKKIEWVVCHRKPERSFFWKGKQFPYCARCTGIYIGYLSLPIFLINLVTINIWWTLALILPTYLDGLTQAYCKRESTNILRLTTGILSGIGTMSLVCILGTCIGNLILYIF